MGGQVVVGGHLICKFYTYPEPNTLDFCLFKAANYTPLTDRSGERDLGSGVGTLRVTPLLPCAK